MNCQALHEWVHTLPTMQFPFDVAQIPENGIYFLFEKGELAHSDARIVRVGTHTGEGQLASRLKQHFVTPNKDRSIFRKNIGRALLVRDDDPFAADWELDLTTRAARTLHGARIDAVKQALIEKGVSDYIQNHFTFAVVPIYDREERLRLELKSIGTLSSCEACEPSQKWFGAFSPDERIRTSGLWQVRGVFGEGRLDDADFAALKGGVL